MKKNDLAEIKKADSKTIDERVAKIYKSLALGALDKNMGKLTNKKELKNKRRDLAQLLTVKRQKEILSGLESQVKEDNQNG